MAEPPQCNICSRELNDLEIGEDYAECPNHVLCISCARRSLEIEIKKLIKSIGDAQLKLRDFNDSPQFFPNAAVEIPVVRQTITDAERRLQDLRVRGVPAFILAATDPVQVQVIQQEAQRIGRGALAELPRVLEVLRQQGAQSGERKNQTALKYLTDYPEMLIPLVAACPLCSQFMEVKKMDAETLQRLNLPNEEPQPQEAVRLDIAEHGRGAAAAVHVPRQRRQSEDDAAAAIAASMESLRDDEMRR